MEAANNVLPFRRPYLIKFERLDVDDMAALFTSKKGGDTYYITLLKSGECEEIHLRRGDREFQQHEFTPEEREHGDTLIRGAAVILKEQLSTWQGLTFSERLSMLAHWGQDMLGQLKDAAAAAAAEDALEYRQEIEELCRDMDNQESYLSALEAVRSLL